MLFFCLQVTDFCCPFCIFCAVQFAQMGNAAAISVAFGEDLPLGITGTNDRCTIFAANLEPDKIDENKLSNLFSLYGNIIRIKILHNKPDHVLIQMADGFQAELAVHLKGGYCSGSRLTWTIQSLHMSDHLQISMSMQAPTLISSTVTLSRTTSTVVHPPR